jgi:DNA-directed RNA polymerase subunit M/transcription elongation factor TFIIS
LYDVASDPALARTYDVKCKACDRTEAVYYQSPVGKNDEALVLVFVCTNRDCKNVWLSSDDD